MYRYETLRAQLFTDEGQKMFLAIRDHVALCLQKAGAVTMGRAMEGARSGDSWTMMACVDRMVELGELREVVRCDSSNVAGQDRVFVGASGGR